MRAKWDASGNVQLAVSNVANVPAPLPGFFTVGYDSSKRSLVFKHNDGSGSGTLTSTFKSDADVSAAAPLTEATTASGISLIKDASTRSLRRLLAGTNITIDGAADANLVTINATGVTALDGLSDAVSTNSGLTLGLKTIALPEVGDVVVGPSAMEAAVTRGNNTAVGYEALQNMKNGSGNVCIGSNAANGEWNGANYNTVVGADAAQVMLFGHSNVYVGHSAGKNGYGFYNCCVGRCSGQSLDEGVGNTSMGYMAGTEITKGNLNVAIGMRAMEHATLAAQNTCIGSYAGMDITTGNQNTIIGSYTGTATMTQNVVLSDGNGRIVAQWTALTNGVFGVDSIVPTLSKNNTMCTYFNDSITLLFAMG